jgi:long-chain acyl-CoA synthetase
VRTHVWKNAPPTLRDAFLLGRAFGERTFVVYRDERASYEAFARAALAVAAALQEAGVGKGDRVAIAMRNLPEWPVAFFGCLLAGGVATLLKAWWTGPELEYGLVDSGAKVAVVDRERLERLAEHLHNCPELKRVFVSRAGEEVAHPKVTKLEAGIGRCRRCRSTRMMTPRSSIPRVRPGSRRAQSGPTATPARPSWHGRRGEPIPAPDPNAPQKSYLLPIPLFHTTGCHAVMIPLIAGGGKLVFMHKWDPELALQIIERERITGTGGVPTIAWQLLAHPALETYDLSSLESIGYGGAPAAAELVRKLKEKFPKSAPGFGWGMTETTSDGWLRTGDIARIDEEGFLFVLDRAKDMLIRGGENIYCIEVENALYEHPAVIDAAVVAIPHQSLGEEPGAVVTLRQGTQASEEELRAFAPSVLRLSKCRCEFSSPARCCRATRPARFSSPSSSACLLRR